MPIDEQKIALRRDMLRFALRKTLRTTGVPAQWIGGEITPHTDDSGRAWLEVRLVIECDEPRFFYYVASFQRMFEASLLDFEPKAWDWVSRITWSIRSPKIDLDNDFEMPPPEYWEHVLRDRELKARQQGRQNWDQGALTRLFEDTEPGDPDFEHTHPPVQMLEDVTRRDSGQSGAN